jgi:hypothetical protein
MAAKNGGRMCGSVGNAVALIPKGSSTDQYIF